MKSFSILLLVVFFYCTLVSCKESFYGEIDPLEKELFLLGEFTNTQGNNPVIKIDRLLSSEEIQIETNANASITNNRIQMTFDNIRIEDQLVVYQIEFSDDIITEELNEGIWEQDVENNLQAFFAQSLDVVLVLDVSSSLGDDVNLVKQYAINFVNSLFNENPNSRIGIVGFSEFVQKLDLTNNKSQAVNFINSLLINEDATKLYEAIDAGIDLIEASSAEGQAIVTFTDGRNNSWTTSQYETSSFVLTRLNGIDIPSYMIGLTGKGGVDETALQQLAVNGLYEFPSSTDDLLNVFDKFANSVVSTYTFVYDRNISPISNPIDLRFRVKVKLF